MEVLMLNLPNMDIRVQRFIGLVVLYRYEQDNAREPKLVSHLYVENSGMS